MRPCSACSVPISGQANRTYDFCDDCKGQLVKQALPEIDCYKEGCTGRTVFVDLLGPYEARYRCDKGHYTDLQIKVN